MDGGVFLDNFFLTARDDDLLASGSRDPLGFEVIWVNFGQTVIPHLNTQSIGARNFGVVTILHWLVDCWMRREELRDAFETPAEMRSHRRKCLLVAESLLVYSTLAKADQDDIDLDQLYGSRRAKRRWRDQGTAVEVSPKSEHLLLSGQYAAGHFGRYDAPLRELGVLLPEEHPADGSRVTKAWKSRIDALGEGQKHIFAPLERALTRCFVGVQDGSGPFHLRDFEARSELAMLRSHQLLAPLTREFASSLHVVGDEERARPQHYLWKVLGKGVDYSKVAFSTAQQQAAVDGNSSATSKLKHVIELEEILARVEALFEVAWQPRVSPTWLANVFDELEERTNIIETLAQEVAGSNSPSEAAYNRLHDLARLIRDSRGHTEFRRGLVNDYHKRIMETERNKTPWLIVEDGEICSLNEAYDPGAPFDEYGNVIEWRRRDYYLGTLNSFYGDYQRAIGDGAAA